MANARDRTLFVIAAFCGTKKPTSPEMFLNEFVEKMLILHEEGVAYNGDPHYLVEFNAVIADKVARDFCKGCKSHAAKKGCERCTQSGYKFENRMTFPVVTDPSPADRTNFRFRNRLDRLHHKFDSPLERLEFLDMVKQFPLNYMHLILVGVLKRWLRILVFGNVGPNDTTHQLSEEEIDEIDRRMQFYHQSLGNDFNRKGLPLRDLKNWKATELRTFLLFTGPLVLKDILSKENMTIFY